MAFKRFWAELKSSEFAALDPNSTLSILPVAATEGAIRGTVHDPSAADVREP